MPEPDKKEKLTFALSEEWRAEFCRAAVERIFKAGAANDSSAAKTRQPAPENHRAAKPKTAIQVGEEMEDGTIYAGVSPDTGKAMYATPADASGTYIFIEAAKYAKNLDAHGHKDFRVPSKNELNVLYQNKEKGKLKGTFNETGSHPAGWYWSSSQTNHPAWTQRFSHGYQHTSSRNLHSSLRCVR